MIIAHISDFHVRADGKLLKDLVDSEAALAAAVRHIKRMRPRPDVVLATGDLVNKGKRNHYRTTRGILGVLPMPVYVIPGNNDDRAKMLEAFAETGCLPAKGEFLHYTVEDFPLRLIALDTLNPAAAEGQVCKKRLKWLKDRLAEQSERPSILFMHHPPFRTGFPCIDEPPFAGADELAKIVRRHANVMHVMCGHVHREIHARWAGTAVSVAPSTAFQMNLDLRPEPDVLNVLEPPMCLVYHWHPDSGLVVHPNAIGDFD